MKPTKTTSPRKSIDFNDLVCQCGRRARIMEHKSAAGWERVAECKCGESWSLDY